MIRLCYSNRFEELAAALVTDLGSGSPGQGIYASRHILVPNQQVATYLKLQVARAAGIAANLRFPFLESFLAEHATVRSGLRVVDRGQLHAILCNILDDDALLCAAEMAPVKAYLHAAGAERDAVELRRFQLAGELAGLFIDYGVARPELVAAWPARCTFESPPHAEIEAWQRRLWLELFGERGVLARLGETTGDEWVALPALFSRVRVADMDLPRRIFIFGFSYLAPAYQQIAARLSARTDLFIYSLNPCMEFWEDLRSGWEERLRGRRLANRGEVVPDEPPDTPALRLWGRPGREHTRLLNELSECDFDPRFVNPAETRDTVLAELQRDILFRAPERATGNPDRAADSSIRILACPSIKRELEVIGNEIWRLVRADSTMRFNDITVLISRRDLERYQAHIGSVFGELFDLPHNIVDVPLTSESRIAEALDHLLGLPFTDFTRPDLLRLLAHPAVMARFPDADRDDWMHWAESLGVVHGASHDDHAGTYIERDLFNWDQGVRRLALGGFMAGARSGDRRAVDFGSQAYVPMQLSRDELPSAATLALLTRSLIADARYCRRTRMPLADWRVFLDLMASSYLAPTDNDEERDLARCRQAIEHLAELDLDGAPVGYRTASELVRAELGGLRASRGEHLADGVTVAPLAPMRALPFRVVFAAGLGEGGFPTTERESPLDLRYGKPTRSDVSPRERDRYLFLETVLSARERLYLSYVARDELTGEALEPSSVVLELEHVLRGYLGKDAIEALTASHPLRRYDERYFPELAGTAEAANDMVSAAPAARAQARALALRRDMDAHFRARGEAAPALEELHRKVTPAAWPRLRQLLGLPADPKPRPRAEGQATLAIPFDAVRKFLECPLQSWARFVLHLRKGAIDDLSAREDEPFATHIGPATGLLREVFTEHLIGGGDVADLLQRYRDRNQFLELGGAAPTGLFSAIERERHEHVLTTWHELLDEIPAPTANTWTTYGFGSAREDQQVGQLLPPVVVPVILPGEARFGGGAAEHQLQLKLFTRDQREVRVELFGRTGPVADPGIGSLVVTTSEKPRPKHRLRGIVDHLALAAAGVRPDEAHGITVLGGNGPPDRRTSAAWSRDDAQRQLAGLLRDMLALRHDYLLPCEAVFEQDAKPDQSIDAIVTRLRGNQNGGFSSLYGPLSCLDDYSAPDPADADDMIERRFGPLLSRLEESDG